MTVMLVMAEGDQRMMHALYELMNGEYKGNALSDIDVSCESHLIAFAAEESRVTGKVVEIK